MGGLYPKIKIKERLTEYFGVKKIKIVNWFQNQRQKVDKGLIQGRRTKTKSK